MTFWRILLVGVGAQCIFLGAGMALLGLGGGLAFLGPFRAGWLDVPNTFLPIWFAIDLIGVALVGLAYRRARAKTVLLALGASGLIVGGVPIGAELAARAQQALAPPGKGAPLRVMSFNSFEGNFAPGRVVATIYRTNPDIVALQEPINLLRWLRQLDGLYPYRTPCQAVNCRLDDPVEAAADQSADLHHPGLSGPEPALSRRRPGHRPGRGDRPGRTDLHPDHHPHGLASAAAEQATPAGPAVRLSEALPRERLIVTGDFNLTPWAFSMRRQDKACARCAASPGGCRPGPPSSRA